MVTSLAASVPTHDDVGGSLGSGGSRLPGRASAGHPRSLQFVAVSWFGRDGCRPGWGWARPLQRWPCAGVWGRKKNICENETLKELALKNNNTFCPRNLWKLEFKGTSFYETGFVQEIWLFSKTFCENETLKEVAFPKHILSKKCGLSLKTFMKMRL